MKKFLEDSQVHEVSVSNPEEWFLNNRQVEMQVGLLRK